MKHAALFRGAPGPSPWYLKVDPPQLEGYEWRDAGESKPRAGKTLLVRGDAVVAVFGFYNWVMRLGPDRLITWTQKGTDAQSTAPVVLRVLDFQRVEAMPDNMEALCESLDRSGTSLFVSTRAVKHQIELSTLVVDQDVSQTFPSELHALDELLILCHSSAAKGPPPPDGSNLALLVANPARSTYRLYPQDWFNHAGLDYGYQWVTRVVRNPRSGRIHGEGIRIAPFVLDQSLGTKPLFTL